MKDYILPIFVAILLCSAGAHGAGAAPAKITIYQRQQLLMQKINQAQTAYELTAAEAKLLRKQLADVSREKSRLKAKEVQVAINDKNNTKGPAADQMTDEDILKLEKMLNDVSTKITELTLKKRVDKR
jgi:hypothetical protein